MHDVDISDALIERQSRSTDFDFDEVATAENELTQGG